MVKFLIVGDLHGSKPKIFFKDFDAILVPGDFCPVEYIRNLMFEIIRKKQKEPSSNLKWYDLCGEKRAKELIEDSINKGREVLEYLDSFGLPVYSVPGNTDWTRDLSERLDFLRQDNYMRLTRDLKNIIGVHHKLISLKECQIIGYGVSSGPEYPQDRKELEKIKLEKLKKIRERYEKEKNKLDKLFQKAEKGKPIIFLSHNVPFNTPLDLIKDRNSPRFGEHFGSLIVREMIEKYQPLISVGGHIHENFGKCKIGKTTCINAGFGSYVNILMEIRDNKICDLNFVGDKRI